MLTIEIHSTVFTYKCGKTCCAHVQTQMENYNTILILKFTLPFRTEISVCQQAFVQVSLQVQNCRTCSSRKNLLRLRCFRYLHLHHREIANPYLHDGGMPSKVRLIVIITLPHTLSLLTYYRDMLSCQLSIFCFCMLGQIVLLQAQQYYQTKRFTESTVCIHFILDVLSAW